MQTAISLAVLLLAIFVYWANPNGGFNKWSAVSMLIFFVGISSTGIINEIVPYLNLYRFSNLLDPYYSISTWLLYTFALPTATVASCYMGYISERNTKISRNWKFYKYMVLLPGIFMIPLFPPWSFMEHQQHISFWIVYTAYNMVFIAFIGLAAIKGVIIENNHIKNEGSILERKQNKKLQEALVVLPPLYIGTISVFPVRLLEELGVDRFSIVTEFWQLNALVIPFSIAAALYFAIKGDGFLGVRIVSMHYSHTLLTNDIFVRNFCHRIKSDTSYMNVNANKIKDALANCNDIDKTFQVINGHVDELINGIEHLNILARKYNRYSNAIDLESKLHNLTDLINEAVQDDNVEVCVYVDEQLCLKCDKSLMIEVFRDIIENSIQAIQAKSHFEEVEGKIVIYGMLDMGRYILKFCDNGIGIPQSKLNRVFEPGVTTKNKEFNSGLGLANCQKVIIKHGGNIYAENNASGTGATITVLLPALIVSEQE